MVDDVQKRIDDLVWEAFKPIADEWTREAMEDGYPTITRKEIEDNCKAPFGEYRETINKAIKDTAHGR